MYNIEAAKKLIEKYRALDLETINKERQFRKLGDSNVTLSWVLEVLFGTGTKCCPLCVAAMDLLSANSWKPNEESSLTITLRDFNEIQVSGGLKCSYCVHSYGFKPQEGLPCWIGQSRTTYDRMMLAETPEALIKAVRLRASYLERKLAKIEKDARRLPLSFGRFRNGPEV